MAEHLIEKDLQLLQQLSPYFPIRDNESVLKLFAEQLKSCEPNLAVLSLVCGFIEHHSTSKAGQLQKDVFPVFEFSSFLQMYRQYAELLEKNLSHINVRVKNNANDYVTEKIDNASSDIEDPQNQNSHDMSMSGTSRIVIKGIADFVWSQLSTSYFKDRPHIQSLYSFLNGKIRQPWKCLYYLGTDLRNLVGAKL